MFSYIFGHSMTTDSSHECIVQIENNLSMVTYKIIEYISTVLNHLVHWLQAMVPKGQPEDNQLAT